jgi:hypothetical protein
MADIDGLLELLSWLERGQPDDEAMTTERHHRWVDAVQSALASRTASASVSRDSLPPFTPDTPEIQKLTPAMIEQLRAWLRQALGELKVSNANERRAADGQVPAEP